MPERVRWGILGTGRMAATIASELATIRDEGHELVAVASRHLPKALEFAARHRIPRALGQYDEIMIDREVDAIYVATPHSLHAANMLACLAGGKAVLCEKPFTLNAGQASAVIAEARRKRLFVMEAMWTRFLPAIDALRGLLAEDAIGQVCLLIGGGAFIPERTAGHYLFEKSLGGGVLLDAGVYLVSMASMILGSPVQVRATARHGDTGVDEQTRCCSDRPTARRPCCTCRCVARRSPDLEILGERGRIRIEAPVFRPAALTIWDQAGSATTRQYPVTGSGFAYQLREVAAALRAGGLESAVMPLDETLSIMRTMDAVREQIGLRYPDESDQPASRSPPCPSYLITGCSSGMGRLRRSPSRAAGDTVVASMRDTGKAAALRAAAEAAALEIRIVALDVTRPETFAGTIESIVADCGRLDVLVNNAGVLTGRCARGPRASAGFAKSWRPISSAPLLLSQAVLPQMRRQRSGCIIMMSSLSGIAGLPGDVAYTASKFAIEGATEALRHEVDRWNIRLALVEPGLYATRIFDASLPVRQALPDSYPADSPYRALIEHRLRELRARLPQAFDPRDVGELLVKIARSDGRQLRWPADASARKVLATMFAQDDATRDAFLRGVSGTDWWSEGRGLRLHEPPDRVSRQGASAAGALRNARAGRGRDPRTYALQPDEHRDGDHDPAREIRSRNALRGAFLLSAAEDRSTGRRARRGARRRRRGI